MIQKSNTQLIAQLFFQQPNKSYSLKDISRTISLAHTSVKPCLDKLLKIKLIIKNVEKKGKRNFPTYVANKNSNMYIKHKVSNNLSNLIQSELIRVLEEKFFPKTIILFGSYLRGEDDETSDIDLFIQSNEEHIDLTKFEKLFCRKIQLHFNKEFRKISEELRNNLINGFVLSGFLDIHDNKNNS